MSSGHVRKIQAGRRFTATTGTKWYGCPRQAATRHKRSRRVLVYGAGQFGQTLVREMRANAHWNMNPVAFIDDDPMKAHRWIMGVPVRGTLGQLEAAMQRYAVDEVVLSSPSINGSIEHRIREVCTQMGRPVRRLHMEIR